MALLLLWAGSGLHADIEVLARFEPSRIAMGYTSRYIVEITSSNAASSLEQIDSLPIPSVSGITLRNGQRSSSQQTSIINGRARYSITQRITIDAIPSSTGSFTIPGYTFDYNGTRLQIPAATLTVVERSADDGPMISELVFLALEAPETLYVGQTKPINLKLHIANTIDFHGYTDFERNAGGFIIAGGPPEEPIKRIETANGRRYTVYNWPLKITPIRTGEQALDFRFELSAVLPNQRNARTRSFGGGIFDNLFGRTERINVYTKPTQINVLPLPADDQPKSFSGAIGQFNSEVSADAKSTRVGEPIMLSLKISGEGNFDRIQPPEIPEANGWRSYPPESAFEAQDGNELKGKKRFDYIFVPEKAGTLELPETSFSFFDPDVEEYVELTSPAIAIEVAPSNLPVVSAPGPSNSATENPAEPSIQLTKSLNPEELMLTLDYRPKKGRKLQSGSMLTASFYWLNGSLLAIFVVTAMITYRCRCLRQSQRYKLVRNARQELKAAISKTGSDDDTLFFSNATKAIRLAATIRAKSDLRNADFATLETQLRQTGVAETMIDQARNLFEAAQIWQFSGRAQTTDPGASRRELNAVLKALG